MHYERLKTYSLITRKRLDDILIEVDSEPVRRAVGPAPRKQETYEQRRQRMLNQYAVELVVRDKERKERTQRLRSLFADGESPWQPVD